MSKVKSRETKIELQFRELLRGYRFRYQPKAFGKPDFASKKLKTVIFIDGCFWHKCPKHFRKPATNNSYWKQKINRNVIRAKEVDMHLKYQGWKVMRFWEHDMKKNPKKVVDKIQKVLFRKKMELSQRYLCTSP